MTKPTKRARHFAPLSKAKEFEAVAAKIGIAQRSIEKSSKQVEQHVVHLKTGGILRWPLEYEWAGVDSAMSLD